MKNLSYTQKAISVCLSLTLVSLIGCGGSGGGGKKSSSSVASSAPASSSSSVAESSSSAASSVTPGAWELVWSDEFDGSVVDSTKWSFERNCWGGGNNELQCYTNRTDNALVEDGVLRIIARDETFSGQSKQDDDPTYDAGDTSITRDYTSARLRTKNKGDWKYGRIDVRAKLPQGQGIWPAIWMLPTDWEYGGWPLSGEIDIMEAVNSNTGTFGNKTHGTLHYGAAYPNNKYTGAEYSAPTNVWEEFHTFSIQWEEGEIRWYVDDVHFATQISSRWYTAASTEAHAPFNKDFHLILNLAVGGNWPGAPNGATTFPQELTIDYVRVYQCDNDSPDGKGCATNVDPEIEPLAGHPQVGGEFASPPLFTMYSDALAEGLQVQSYNPNGTTSSSQIDEDGRGKVFNVVKTGGPGNVYFNITSGAANLSDWTAEGKLKFDYKINSKGDTSTLLVKIDSGWPSVSDVSITDLSTGIWHSYSIDVADLLDNGNSIESGTANINAITNIFVIEPSAAMDVSFDNVRLEVEE